MLAADFYGRGSAILAPVVPSGRRGGSSGIWLGGGAAAAIESLGNGGASLLALNSPARNLSGVSDSATL